MKRVLAGIVSSRLLWLLPVMAMLCPPALGQIRVVSYNVAQMRGQEAAMGDVLAEASLDDHAGPAYPVSVFVFQEVTNSTFTTLSGLLGADYTAATYTNSGEDNFGGAQAMFYRADTLIEIPSGHDGTYTGAGRRARRWQLRLLGYDNPVVDFYVYSGHLKAGTGSGNQDERVFGMTNILNNSLEIAAGSHIIICGDFNFYSSNEPGYATLVGHEIQVIIDPHGTDNWTGVSGALKHTQSPRTIAEDGLASGGLDDRFDFQVSTTNIADSEGLAMIEGSLRSMGNDGNHYNEAINDGTNTYYPGDTARSNSLADALHDASDHLPLAADYMIPATLDAAMFNANFGEVITGGTVSLTVNVSNLCAPAYVGGGSDLSWYLDGTGTVEGATGSGSLAPGETQWVDFELSPDSSGGVNGDLLVRSDGDFVQGQPVAIPISGTVLRHADGSFSSESDVNWTVSSHSVNADTGLQTLLVSIWNYGWDAQQAALDLDGVSGVDAPFAFAGGLMNGITAQPATLSFAVDTTGLIPGQTYADVFTIEASDEDLSGEAQQTLTLSLVVEVGADSLDCEGDYNGSGITDIEDLLFVLNEYGSTYGVEDILLVISDWNCGS